MDILWKLLYAKIIKVRSYLVMHEEDVVYLYIYSQL